MVSCGCTGILIFGNLLGSILMKKLFYLSMFLLFALLAITINLKNPQVVSLHYYLDFHAQASLMVVLSVTFILGLFFGWLFMTVSVLKNKRQVGKAKRELARVEKEVKNLRTMPIKDSV